MGWPDTDLASGAIVILALIAVAGILVWSWRSKGSPYDGDEE